MVKKKEGLFCQFDEIAEKVNTINSVHKNLRFGEESSRLNNLGESGTINVKVLR